MTPSEGWAAQKTKGSCLPLWKVKYDLFGRGNRNQVTQKTPENQISGATRQLPSFPVLYPLIYKRVGFQLTSAAYQNDPAGAHQQVFESVGEVGG